MAAVRQPKLLSVLAFKTYPTPHVWDMDSPLQHSLCGELISHAGEGASGQNNKIALGLKFKGQMSLKPNHFWDWP